MSNRLFDPVHQKPYNIAANNLSVRMTCIDNELANWRTWAEQTEDAALMAAVEAAIGALVDVRARVREMMRG